MGFKTWKEKRKAKKESRRDPYDVQELRLLTKLNSLEPGTEEYKEIQSELKSTNVMRGESRETKRRISKADKGGIVVKTLGILGSLVGIGSVIWAERNSMTFTGEKRTIMDSICRGLGNVFHR